jgi:hypothetical protein
MEESSLSLERCKANMPSTLELDNDLSEEDANNENDDNEVRNIQGRILV